MMNLLLNAAINWKSVGLVLALIAGLAVVLTILILIVTKVCHIEEDKKMLQVLERLAGANCGGCGYSGCEGFAKGLCSGKAKLADCKATSNEDKKVIAQLTNLPFVAETPTVAVVKCNGGDNAINKFDYVGYDDCINEMVFHKGRKICATACLGHGSCNAVCPRNAIRVDKEAKIAVVEKAICISCGACINKCPKLCIERIPAAAPVYVACNTKCRGKDVISQCKNGCIGCGLCAKNCPNSAITMVDNLPVIDYEKCNGCLTCVSKCPKKVIKTH